MRNLHRRILPAFISLAAAGGCAAAPAAVPVSADERAMPPAPALTVAEPVLLSHMMRASYFLATGYPSPAVVHLRLALIYDPDSPYIYEKLCLAWRASGDEAQARVTLAAGLQKLPDAPGLNLIAGEDLALERDFAAAAPHFAKALSDDTLLVQAGPALVDALLWSGALESAPAQAQQMMARAPGDANLATALGAVFEDHGQLALALDYVRRAREQQPTSEVAAAAEVRLLGLLGRPAEAATALMPLLGYYPDDVSLLASVWRLHVRAASPEATLYRDEALRQSGGDADALMRVAHAAFMAGRADAGVEILRRAVHDNPGDANARLYLVDVLSSLGDHAGCLALLPERPDPGLAKSAADVAALHHYRSRCLAGLGQLDDALREGALAVRDGAARDELIAMATLIAASASDEAAAAALWDKLVAQVSDLATGSDIREARSVLLELLGHGREALTIIDELHAASPGDLELALRWADLTARYGDRRVAIAALEEALQAAPDDPARLNALGFLLADAGERLPEAEVWLRRAYRLASEHGYVIDSLGWLLFWQGKLNEAITLLEQASAASLGDAEILCHLGDAYAAAGRWPEALAAYQRALATRPNIELAQRLRARLANEARDGKRPDKEQRQ